jgi:cyclic beta-1,2-glucan synthetase
MATVSDDPIRAELFSLERLGQHAKTLAAAQIVTGRPTRQPALLSRVKKNGRALYDAYRSIAAAVHDGQTITPAAEWFIDNYHIIEAQISEIVQQLPPGYYKKLPKLTSEFLEGAPRVYGVAWAYVAHTDSRFDSNWLETFISSYQSVEPLSVGEVWALPISLRILLVENLRRVVDRMMAATDGRLQADALADSLMALNGQVPADPKRVLAEIGDAPLQRSFAVQLVQRFRDKDEAATPVLNWLEGRLALQGTSADDIVRMEHQEQTAKDTTVRNLVTSLRLMESMDWTKFFENVSAVDKILRAGHRFSEMDFQTRDRYRHAIEDLSERSSLSEVEVARRVVATAEAEVAVVSGVESDRVRDIGFHLIGRGRRAFEQSIGYRSSVVMLGRRLCRTAGTPLYLGGIALFTAFAMAWPLWESGLHGMPAFELLVLGGLALFPASDLAVALMNRLVTRCIGPERLPKLDFEKGIPISSRVLVVMPVLLNDRDSVREQIERLETHYLGNPDGYVQFALLADWTDAPEESRVDDAPILDHAKTGIQELNLRHGPGPDGLCRFALLHRGRGWNAGEGVWMAWERKRGKLHDLNRFLRGATDTHISTLFPPGAASLLGVRYVLTLDADTRMARGSAYQLAATISHPLNRPHFDSVAGRVTDGYAIIQPRITPTLPVAGFGSLFQWIFSGPSGIDPYSFAVSDVYQDLFGEGSFVGKGIYDVDAFELAMKGRVPENTVLSHDLLEGIFARTALATDIELFEEYPSSYLIAEARLHRWVRGDWQLVRWMVRDFGGRRLPLIGRWKLIDNLRRSLSPPALFLLVVVALLVPTAPVAVLIPFAIGAVALPSFLSLYFSLLPRQRGISFLHHFRTFAGEVRLSVWQVFLGFAFLSCQARLMADAIFRTLYRSLFSHHGLLEWNSTSGTTRRVNLTPSSFYRKMITGPLSAAALLVAAFSMGAPGRWGYIVPFCVLWFLAPWTARRVSLPISRKGSGVLSHEDRRYFRLIARKTWRFFETFVTERHHHLPPDNFQEIPNPVVAHRTSPTNIGLYLLSTVSAKNFGWMGILDTVDRLELTVKSVKSLRRHDGHLFNWYDTLELRPLEPLYVSTVDSGNLAGHLWALGSALRAMAGASVISPHALKGFEDTFHLIQEAAASTTEERRSETVTRAQLLEAVESLGRSVRGVSSSPDDLLTSLDSIRRRCLTLIDVARALAGTDSECGENDVAGWAHALARQVASHRRDIETLFPPGQLNDAHRLGEMPAICAELLGGLADHESVRGPSIERAQAAAASLLDKLDTLARLCDTIVEEMNFRFLFDAEKKIFSIGYLVHERKLDVSYYDLLASEARLASFVAIAKGDVPALHWFRLGRALTSVDRGLALLSWSGSMFEYLMPSIVMRPPPGSLLDKTCRQIVRRQIAYGAERNVPWGVSESAYNVQDLEFTYQYTNFGVPGLGLKRGLADALLIAPYATALAAMVNPTAAADNFRELARVGAEGKYGFFESLDYTVERLPEGQKVAVVRTYMAHHQGMILTSFENVLHNDSLRRVFHDVPRVQATELLLQERIPRVVGVARARMDQADHRVREPVVTVLRRFHSPHGVPPRTQLLSNGRYSVMVTASGSGYSSWRDKSVTRWREDATRDAHGTYVFLRDVRDGTVWSAGHQPTGMTPDLYEVDFSEGRVEFLRRDGDIETKMDIVVSPEDDAELRRITIRNLGGTPREIDVTSYAEVVLATAAADQAHPAFSNLFVSTEFIPGANALLCSRRPRSPEETPLWAAHIAVTDGETVGSMQMETDRARFLGRGRDIRTPMSVMDGKPLSNTVGAVLDPIVSLRYRIRLNPGENAHVTFTTLVAPTRIAALDLAGKYHDPTMFERTVTQAWTHAHVQQNHLGLTPAAAHLYQELAGRIIFSHGASRPAAAILRRNTKGPSGLWAHGISGDLPIVLVRIDEIDDSSIIQECLRACEYWRMKYLAVDLVIVNERVHSYSQELQVHLEAQVRSSQGLFRANSEGPRGGIFVLRGTLLSPEERFLLRAAARVTINSQQGPLALQIERMVSVETERPLVEDRPTHVERRAPQPDMSDLTFFNGLGGFSPDGREYVTTLGPGQWTPAPWVNVVANPEFGFQASESGSGYTWSLNSRENQLTPWSNDPVSDPSGEVFYVRDEETGVVWTPTALPIRGGASVYVSRHGHGYSQFEHVSEGVETMLLQYVSPTDPVKISRLTMKNISGRPRRLSVTGYLEWVLGTSRGAAAPFIITEMHPETGAMLAINPWNSEFGQRVAFARMDGAETWTGDRSEFLGRNGSVAQPAAMSGIEPLSGSVGPALDPCAALRKTVEMEPGQVVEVLFVLGQAAGRDEAIGVIKRTGVDHVQPIFDAVRKQWDDILSTVTVTTPDRSMDLMLNGWLLYQTLSCRLWARCGFYQAGGAYGFRDQLQDVLALIVSRRDIAREQILRAASRQFPEGDVQHWWHPPSGRGVRTRISDDLLWLPYVVNRYIEVTGDVAILDASVPFIEGIEIPAGREDAYFEPRPSVESATLYEHCARALERSLATGAHGLPLMGTGDWNDGMNRVGHEGKGESIWLAWFLHATLWEFSKVAESRGDCDRAEKWRLHVSDLKASVEHHGWDGEWYRRAFFDDGSPLGSAVNSECRIDSIAQSWAVLSGAADPARAARAMAAVKSHLVRMEERLLLLFSPPFETSVPNPGYIQGYLPGVRENGGQYSHAAAWTVQAFAALGDGDLAASLFSLLNPINHGSTRADIQRYKVEPYVMAGDIYSNPQHVGRGGWTWYTGSAGWMYRTGLESILGFNLRDTTLFMDPCIPKTWPGFKISFRYHAARYEVIVDNPEGVNRGVRSIDMDGRPHRTTSGIPLQNDGATHQIRITLGRS